MHYPKLSSKKSFLTWLLMALCAVALGALPAQAQPFVPRTNKAYRIAQASNNQTLFQISTFSEAPQDLQQSGAIKSSSWGSDYMLINGAFNVDNAIYSYTAANAPAARWIIFRLDNPGENMIVSRKTGKALGITKNENLYPVEDISWQGAAWQRWFINSVSSSGQPPFFIKNANTSRVFDIKYPSGWANGTLVQSDLIPTDPSHQFVVFEEESFNLPQIPQIEDAPPVPAYTSIDDVLPQATGKTVGGATLVPCPMVNDAQKSEELKIQDSPYYLLLKKQYWTKLNGGKLQPGQTVTFTAQAGISASAQQAMKDTYYMSVQSDFGLAFKSQAVPLQQLFSTELETFTSSNATELGEYSVSKTVRNDNSYAVAYSTYALVAEFSLYRTDGTLVENGEYAFVNDTQLQTTVWPATASVAVN